MKMAFLGSAIAHGVGVLAWTQAARPLQPVTPTSAPVLAAQWIRLEAVPRQPRSVGAQTPRSEPAAAVVAEAGARAPAHAEAKPVPTPPPAKPEKTSEEAAAEAAAEASRFPPLPPAPDYRTAAAVDVPPHPLADIDPRYPEAADRQQGSVVLRLLINEGGTVDNVGVVKAFPPGLFEEEARLAFEQAAFAPARRGGAPVKSQLVVEVQFIPFNRGAVSGQGY